MENSIMEAKDYLQNHWIKNKIWTHLLWAKHQQRFERCASFLEGEDFIDVGCGLGHSTFHLSHFKVGHWSGMEFFRPAVLRARKIFPEFKHYFARNFDLIKSTKKRFDSVVCSEVIEHVEEDQELFEGLLSITEKVLVITTPNVRVSDPGHLRIYTAKSLMSLFLNSRKKCFDFTIVPRVQIISEGKFFYMVIDTGRQ
jgi:2-polyprenyl-3-methyl-5-hydroxy-6-metoxy-1,4-benzoquinol methylase